MTTLYELPAMSKVWETISYNQTARVAAYVGLYIPLLLGYIALKKAAKNVFLWLTLTSQICSPLAMEMNRGVSFFTNINK